MRKGLGVFVGCYIKQHMATIITSKNINIFTCKICDFKCCKKGDYNRHILTSKHKLATNSNEKHINDVNYTCDICNKNYQDRSGLWRHKKTCLTYQIKNNIDTEQKSPNLEIDKELLIKLLLKNQDVMEKMIEIMPTMGNNSHNTTNTNSHNTQNFNIQMFLNDHCKNAMNLTDFIDTLPITAETYDHTIENGLTKTITNMITNGLSQLDILERPIHCTDASRKTLYVKEDNAWEKDNELIRVLVGIRNLAYKQRTLINKWKDVNDGWEKEDNIQTKLTMLICNSMTDIENDEKETNKIIRAIGKNTYLTSDIKDVYKSA